MNISKAINFLHPVQILFKLARNKLSIFKHNPVLKNRAKIDLFPIDQILIFTIGLSYFKTVM